MAYNRKYLLRRIIEVQDIVKTNIKRGISQKHTYHNEIEPKYKISYGTFCRWMSYPAQREFKSDFPDAAKTVEKAQLTLW